MTYHQQSVLQLLLLLGKNPSLGISIGLFATNESFFSGLNPAAIALFTLIVGANGLSISILLLSIVYI